MILLPLIERKNLGRISLKGINRRLHILVFKLMGVTYDTYSYRLYDYKFAESIILGHSVYNVYRSNVANKHRLKSIILENNAFSGKLIRVLSLCSKKLIRI